MSAIKRRRPRRRWNGSQTGSSPLRDGENMPKPTVTIGYCPGTRERMLTTSLGPVPVAMPRARVRQADGTTREWRSATVRWYERRTTRVDWRVPRRRRGQIKLRALDGYVDMKEVRKQRRSHHQCRTMTRSTFPPLDRHGS
jgi:hypothetical protein